MNKDQIKALEKPLNILNSMSVNVGDFKQYIQVKAEVGLQVVDHYKQLIYRKLSYRSKILGKNSITKFLHQIEATFGRDGRPVALLYGNWSRSSQMKGLIPTPGIELKKECARRFRMLDIDEFGSSKYCAECYSELENRWVNGVKLHRVLVCQGCSDPQDQVKVPKFVHRDINGGKNIRNRGLCELRKEPIPSVFCRSKDFENSTVQQKNCALKKVVPIIKKKNLFAEQTVTPKEMLNLSEFVKRLNP